MARGKLDEKDAIVIRQPDVDDGGGIWRVVREASALDPNSSYLYLLLAKDFSDTCVVAECDGEIVGFVTGYRPPRRHEVVFLWQVGLLPSMQGRGLGKRLVLGFLGSPGARGATVLETTVAPSNTASRALFLAIARQLGAQCHVSPCFSAHMFPEGGHEDEELYCIGPLPQTANVR
ncbi:MAG: diaminobutyrate acetyltransferase [Nitrococcus sp.]|nr:diaminobutyrate acetyltransferase [Nitrococcus sp.]